VFFKKRQIDFESASLSRQTWIRFKRNRLAMFGFLVIVSAAVVSILGYLITPDDTTFANDQKLELFIKAPGFKVQMLRVVKNEETPKENIIKKMLFGVNHSYVTYSMRNWYFKGKDIVIEEYNGNSNDSVAKTAFNLADVIYATNTKFPVYYDSIQQNLQFVELGKTETSIKSIKELQDLVKENSIYEKTFVLGTDLLGRDLLSRLMIGTRISLGVGLVSVVISLFIGVLLGALAGYYRGTIDACIMWLLNVVWTIPTVLLVISITLVLGKGVIQVFIAVGLTMWVDVARIVRGQVLGIREKEYVEAGRALGFKNSRIIFRHILPNVMGPVIVIAASNFATAILTEAGLSFLGIGAQSPIPSWGEMTNAHRGYILMDKAYLAFIPGMAIMLLVLSFVLVGNGLRDALDSRAVDAKPILNV